MRNDLGLIENLALQVSELRIAVLLTCTFAMKAATLAASEDREKSKKIADDLETILNEIHARLNFASGEDHG